MAALFGRPDALDVVVAPAGGPVSACRLGVAAKHEAPTEDRYRAGIGRTIRPLVETVFGCVESVSIDGGACMPTRRQISPHAVQLNELWI